MESNITHVLHDRSTNFCVLVIFHTFITLIALKVKLKVKTNEIFIYGFIAIPIHSTTVHVHVPHPEDWQPVVELH